MRRIAGILVMLLLANTSVAGAVVICTAAQTLAAGEQGREAADHAHHHAAGAPADAGAEDPVPGETPSGCCQAMTTCASLGITATAVAAQVPDAQEVALTRHRSTPPPSRSAAPEPPPPRA